MYVKMEADTPIGRLSDYDSQRKALTAGFSDFSRDFRKSGDFEGWTIKIP
jgi:hypothetical protein